jgi:hypothetical protein
VDIQIGTLHLQVPRQRSDFAWRCRARVLALLSFRLSSLLFATHCLLRPLLKAISPRQTPLMNPQCSKTKLCHAA